ncbi:MAG TPA: dihydroorotate dehydrogenase electron transfer subunit [Dehalococcoidia bacterium]|nr:dihydroorotate dehydrogenase electron transfer subunit [Dehalococcoidia bacterium]
MPGVYLTWLESPQIASPAEAGQFVMVRCGEEPEYPLRRPFSIHQRQGGKIALLFNIVGKGTQWLAQRQPGDELDLLGPLGNGFTINPKARHLLLLAGGIGIAPLVSLADEALKRELSVTLLYGTPSAAQLYPHLPKVKIVTATEDGSAGKKGMITDLLPDFISGADQIFACGPLPMYRAMAAMPELSNKPVQVSLEVRMGCGQGICYGCTVKTRNGLKQVCQHGPVFELNDILWDELKEV